MSGANVKEKVVNIWEKLNEEERKILIRYVVDKYYNPLCVELRNSSKCRCVDMFSVKRR